MSATEPSQAYREMVFCTNCQIDSEITNFVWEIKNVQHLMKWPSKTCPSLHFDAGSTIGLPSKWIFSLIMNSNPYPNNLIIRLELQQSPEEIQTIFAHSSAEIKRLDGSTAFTSSIFQPKNFKQGYGEMSLGEAMNSLIAGKDPKNVVVEDGCLKVHLTFKLYSSKGIQTEQIGTKLNLKFNERGRKAVVGDLEKLLDSGENADVTFQFRTGEFLKAHKLILGARSPVFRAMFQTEMKESSTGVVPIEDVTFEGMKFILKFFYCGKVDENWKEKTLIQDLLNAAEKYSLPALKQFFNQSLHSVCTHENILDLLNLARLYNLELAEKNILYFMNQNA